jgi:hypothetical protein
MMVVSMNHALSSLSSLPTSKLAAFLPSDREESFFVSLKPPSKTMY